MSDFQKQVLSDLAKKYTFETFDFKNKSPEDLLIAYQEALDKIQKIVNEQDSKSAKESIEAWLG